MHIIKLKYWLSVSINSFQSLFSKSFIINFDFSGKKLVNGKELVLKKEEKQSIHRSRLCLYSHSQNQIGHRFVYIILHKSKFYETPEWRNKSSH